MEISNEARAAMLGGMKVIGTEVIEAPVSSKGQDSIKFHLDNGAVLAIERHPIKGLIVNCAARQSIDQIRIGDCICPVRPFANPPVFSPDCPQHKELVK